MNLQEITEKIKKMVDNHQGQLKAKVNFNIDSSIIHIDDTVTPAEISNEEKDADCTIIASAENFVKIINGDINPMMAVMTGKMKIKGNQSIAMKLASIF